jgi:dTDP-4-dehydrorhamnose reductase
VSEKTTSENNPNIAIIGSRGIPNSYGGFETLAEEISDRLVGFGARVTVYCRRQYFKERPSMFKGVHLVYLPTITTKALDTLVHTFLSVLHTIFARTADTLIIVNVGNAPFALLAKLFGKKVIFCVDGLDWQRKKWNGLARVYLKACSLFAKLSSHAVVTDAQSVLEYYKHTRKTDSYLIPYGTDIETEFAPDESILEEYHLAHKQYFIYVARFEPENNPLQVVKSYVASGSTLPLVMIGDNRYDPDFVRAIKESANERVIFLGYVFGERYKQLLKHALAYVRAAEVGGLSPAVIEAMGRGVCVLANDKPENREALSDTGIFYKLTGRDLETKFKHITLHQKDAIEYGKKSAERAMVVYSWDTVAYEFFKLVKKVAEKDTAVDVAHLRGKGSRDKKKILIAGAGGMLGAAMYEYFSKHYTILATSNRPSESWIHTLDVRDVEAYDKVVANFRPDYIFHLPALTNLEYCENHLPEAYATNTLSAKHAAQIATKYGAKLVYVSSSNVFDGTKKYYSDADEPHPINVYGLTKHMGALMAEYYARDYVTIRLGWLMGGGPKKDKKFVAKIVEQIVMGKTELHALVDKAGSVSYTRDVARNLEILLKSGAHGTYNMVSTGMPTRYEVAKEIVRILGYEKQIKVTPVDSSFFSQTFTTSRSASECLINERLSRERLSVQVSWQDALEDYLTRDFAYAFSPTSKTALDKPALI